MGSEPQHPLDETEQLQLLQLLELESWADRSTSRLLQTEPRQGDTRSEARPIEWSFLQGIRLHEWQQEAVNRWFDAGNRGIVKVVTGAGKTLLALAAAERLQKVEGDLRIAIVVPTIVLLDQWREELTTRSNLPTSMIGALGGGADDHFDETRRILICVLNSAARKLPEQVRRSGFSKHLLLIVDECHRAGASEMRKLFEVPRAFTLGLSATPERDDEQDDWEGEEGASNGQVFSAQPILDREIGPVVYEMNYAQALNEGVLAPFTIEHYALSLNETEQTNYTALSQEITDLRRQLETRSRRGLALIRWCRSRAGTKEPRARRLISLITERKQLLYRIEQRFKVVDRLIAAAIANDSNSRIIIFHESIAEVMNLFVHLRRLGYRVVAEHSELPDRLRAQAISLFRKGTAQIIVSAKSLIEGFNVPSADVGIVVAASSSVRQRIQTLGRLLRRGKEQDVTKKARLIVLFAANTVDEMIYEKADWNSFVGAERNEYFRWIDVEKKEPEKLVSAPREYIPSDAELQPGSLSPGDRYPGKLDGSIYSVDVTGTVFDTNRHPILPDDDLASKLTEFQGGGRFLVTPKRHYMVRLPRSASGTDATYLGQLRELPRSTSSVSSPKADQLKEGSEYPLDLARGKIYSVLQRDERLIATKRRGEVTFVQRGDKISDTEKRTRLERIQESLRRIYRNGHLISKIFVNEFGHVGYIHEGRAYFLGFAPEGQAGFVFEDS